MHNKETDMDKQDQKILALLKDYPMPEATAGYFDQALVRATHEGSRRQRNRWLSSQRLNCRKLTRRFQALR